jgi:glycerol-1-phosphate dehydrogenase [NAD(P)+]
MIIDSQKYAGSCSCGRNHEMFTKKVVIEAGCLKHIDDYLAELGLTGRKAAIYDSNTYHAKGLIRPNVDQEIILDPTNLHANEQATGKILEQLKPDMKMLIAVGSGTIHDCTRYCANKLGIPFIACPTAASVDGFCSTVSAMTWKGYKKTLPGVAPILVLADIDVIKQAPIELALSGVGDVLGKFTSLADWKISHALTGEYFCPVIEDMTRQAVVAVKNCCEQIKVGGDPKAFEHLIYGLLLSGLAMQMCGNSRPASAAEHHISHLIEVEPASLNLHNRALHGEKVGVGTVIVSSVYHKLAEISDIAPYIKEYSPLNPEEMKSVFGNLFDSVMSENQNDCLKAVSPEALIKNWGKIREIIHEIPTPQELLNLYTKIGAKKTLADIGVNDELLPKILHYSPCIRNRLTLMRIRRMLTV